MALFLGSWSDKNGGARKAPLLIGLVGKLYYSCMLIAISMNSSWPLYTVLYGATLPAAATGADLAIFMACFSYMADITTPEERTVRITMLQVSYLLTIPVGVALGQLLFTATGESVPAVFGVNATLVFIAFVYSAFRLIWRSAPQSPNDPPVRKVPLRLFCCDFFDYTHLRETVRAIVRRRPGHRRAYLIALLFAMALYTFQRGCLFGLPLITKVCGLPDAAAILIGASAHALARVLYILAKVPWLLYVGAVLGAMGPVVAPVIKSMVSKVVPIRERGKVQAVLACADNAVPLFSGVIYSQTYNATIDTFPGAVFLITIASQLLVMSLLGGIQFSLGRRPLDDGETPTHCDPAESKDIMAGDSSGDPTDPNPDQDKSSSSSADSKQPVC
ncbi:hypothetical protein B566_EDAN002071 [Ephemera danica]|nr:hypothetical protein B566_EDAN002071 [Ephemera danica]